MLHEITHKPRYNKKELLDQGLIALNQFWYQEGDVEEHNGKRFVKAGARPVYVVQHGELVPFSQKQQAVNHKPQNQDYSRKGPEQNRPPENNIVSHGAPDISNPISFGREIKKAIFPIDRSNVLAEFPDDIEKLMMYTGANRREYAKKLIKKYKLSTNAKKDKVYFRSLPNNQYDIENPEVEKHLAKLFSEITDLPLDRTVDVNAPHIKQSRLEDRLKISAFVNPDTQIRKINLSSNFIDNTHLHAVQIDNDVFLNRKTPDARKWFQNERARFDTDEELNHYYERVLESLKAYNKKLYLLSTYVDIPVLNIQSVEGNGISEKLHTMFIDKLREMVQDDFITKKQFNVIRSIVDDISTAKNTYDFNKFAGQLTVAIQHTNLSPGIQSFLTLASAMHLNHKGYNINIPSDNENGFQLLATYLNENADIYSRDNIEQQIQFISVLPHPSIDPTKSNTSEFITDMTQFTSDEVESDLMTLSGVVAERIFETEPDQLFQLQNIIDQLLDKEEYRDAINTYFKLDLHGAEISDDIDVIKRLLSNGTSPAFQGEISNIFKRQDLNNRDKWKMHSLVGNMYEALYNTHLQRQLFNVHIYNGNGLYLSDGATSFGKSVFRFLTDFKDRVWPLEPKTPLSYYMFYADTKDVVTRE